jgi:LicD family
MSGFWRVCILLLVLLSLCVLFIPLPWRDAHGYPDYPLCYAVYNEYAKKKHEWLRIPLDLDICHENLALVQDVLAEHGVVQWSLSEGTALGVKRSGDLIPWDDDVDIAIPGIYETVCLEKVLPQLKRLGFLHVLNDKVMPMLCLIRRGQKVDVSFLQPGQTCAAGYLPCDQVMALVDPLEAVTVRGRVYYVPAREDYYVALYGKSWRTPNRRDKSTQGDRREIG